MVTRTDDPNPNGCRPNDCSLREAIIASNNRPGRDVVELPAGRYELTRPTPGEDASQSGDLDVLKPVKIAGVGQARTVIDANLHDRVFTTAADDVVMSKLTMLRGDESGSGAGGGGIVNVVELTLNRVTVRNNRTDFQGGGIRNFGKVVLVRSRITGNESTTTQGGGIANVERLIARRSRIDHNEAASAGGGMTNSLGGHVTLFRTSVDHNISKGCCGAGVHGEESSRLRAVRSSFNENQQEQCCGGGLYFEGQTRLVLVASTVRGNETMHCCGAGVYVQDEATATISRTRIQGNRLTGTQCCGAGLYAQGLTVVRINKSNILNNRLVAVCCGSAAYLQQDAFMRISNSIVRSNVQEGSGPAGALYGDHSSVFLLRNSTLANNSSEADGGALYLQGSAGASLVNSTISGNSSGGFGGGIFEDSNGVMGLTHTTITRNRSDGLSGGIDTNGGVWDVRRTIVAGNEDDDCNVLLTGPTGKNLDSDSTCFNSGNPIHGAPRLGPLATNGGKTPNHLPRRSSPAVDQVGGGNCGEPQRDQRGVKRPQNGDGRPGTTCDLGAVERKPGE